MSDSVGTALKGVLEDDLSKTKEIVAAVQVIQQQQEEADARVRKESEAHSKTKQKIKSLEQDAAQKRKDAEEEIKCHVLTKERLQKEGRYHERTKDALAAAKDDVASMRLQMDAMKGEMEAQRKAFVVNVNWAARCTELKAKFDQSQSEYDQLLELHVRCRSELDMALRAREEYCVKNDSAVRDYDAARAELAKMREELASRSQVSDDIAAKLAELQEWKDKQAAETVKKRQGNQQALSVLQRSQAQGESGLKIAAFQGWASLTATEKKTRLHKDKAMKRAMKTIANEGTALLQNVFKEWVSDYERDKRAALQAAHRRLQEQGGVAGGSHMTGRQRAIQQLEKQFQGEDKALTKSCFDGWALGQVARKRKEQNHNRASRMIANSGLALQAEIFGVWNTLTEKTRKKKKAKEASTQQAARLIANSSRALQAEIFSTLYGWIQDVKRKRKTDEAGTAKAVRMMANSAQALMNICFDSWARIRKNHLKKDAGNKKALRMMADSAQALIVSCWSAWAKVRKEAAKTKEGHAKAVRMIANSSEALVAVVFQTWSSYSRNNKDRNKKIRALEKTFGAQDHGLKMLIFTTWQPWAAMEARKKKCKEHSMKSAIKSITGGQTMLLEHLTLAWARVASLSKKERLPDANAVMQAKVEEAVEQARVALMEEIDKAQNEAADVQKQIAGVKQEIQGAQVEIENYEAQVEQSEWDMKEGQNKIESVQKELEASKRKAKEIGDELGKVGLFLSQTQTTRKSSRSGRPSSGMKDGYGYSSTQLPRIDTNSRPGSGSSKGGSKSARGVQGERVGSARRRKSAEERRYLDDAGPYTYAEFIDILAPQGLEFVSQKWQASTVAEQLQDDL